VFKRCTEHQRYRLFSNCQKSKLERSFFKHHAMSRTDKERFFGGYDGRGRYSLGLQPGINSNGGAPAVERVKLQNRDGIVVANELVK
jgi:hypothetical protein